MVDSIAPQPESWSQPNFGQTFSLDIVRLGQCKRGLYGVLKTQLSRGCAGESFHRGSDLPDFAVSNLIVGNGAGRDFAR